jgi:hypothetical protein
LHSRDLGVLEESFDESSDHGTSKTSAKLVFVRKELIDSSRSGISLGLPPPVTRTHDDVRLYEADGLALEESDVRTG